MCWESGSKWGWGFSTTSLLKRWASSSTPMPGISRTAPKYGWQTCCFTAMTSQWHHDGDIVTSWWCHSEMMLSQWHHDGVTVTSHQWLIWLSSVSVVQLFTLQMASKHCSSIQVVTNVVKSAYPIANEVRTSWPVPTLVKFSIWWPLHLTPLAHIHPLPTSTPRNRHSCYRNILPGDAPLHVPTTLCGPSVQPWRAVEGQSRPPAQAVREPGATGQSLHLLAKPKGWRKCPCQLGHHR